MQRQTTVNPDLKKERAGVTFDPLDLTFLLWGGREKVKRKQFIENLAYTDEVFEGPEYFFLSTEERYEDAVRREVHLERRVRELNLTDEDDLRNFELAALTGDGQAFGGHKLGFMKAVLIQATDEQTKKWKPLFDNFHVIGCYGQTELGHGSHVRGLETRADYDPRTQQFVLNTPTLTATKWWPGNLGKSSNHTLLIAQTYTQGKCMGPHAFLVPIRDIETHKPLPGVKVGTIGPKLGLTGVDSGFLTLKDVRIPRENMLMKFAQVLPDGRFKRSGNERAMYASMMNVRARIPGDVALMLASAVTIATRYSLVRRQSELQPGAREPQIMDYQTQQHKILPAIGMAYAFWFVSKWIKEKSIVFKEEMQKGNLQNMLPLHAATSCIKAYITYESAQAIEFCRLACGGHGYSMASGLPKLFTYVSALVTGEGDTTVLYLQTARYLVKAALNVQQGKPLEPTLAYLADSGKQTFQYTGDTDLQALLQAFQHRAARCVQKAASRMQTLLGSGVARHDAWNQSSVFLAQAAKAHAEVLVMQALVDQVLSKDVPKPLQSPLLTIAAIFGINRILAASGELIVDGWMKPSDLNFLKEKLYSLYETARPDAIAYVDAFDIHDRQLVSVLGRYDGDVYNNLYKWAQRAPLNKTQVHESFYKYTKPMREQMSRL